MKVIVIANKMHIQLIYFHFIGLDEHFCSVTALSDDDDDDDDK